jgi:hypothetical protein
MTEETNTNKAALSTKPAVQVVAPDSLRGIFEEALAEVENGKSEQVKKIIKQRILEIKRLEALVVKAKQDLQELLDGDIEDIALF